MVGIPRKVNDMNAQEIFDTVAKHLFTQGERSFHEGMCLYRGPHGTKCAVGVLMSDEVYDQKMDHHPDSGPTDVCSIVNNFALPDWFKENINLLISLQYAHDHVNNWQGTKDMRDKLREVAREANLDSSIVDTLKFDWATK